MKNGGEGEGGLIERGRLINFPPLKGGGLLEREGLRGSLPKSVALDFGLILPSTLLSNLITKLQLE